MTKSYKTILAVAVLLAVIGVLTVLWQVPKFTVGSVIPGGEYLATTTAQMAQKHNPIATNRVVTLGSIIVASSSATTFTIWNATSTNDVASTSVTTLKTSIGEGTYTFDAELHRGLIVETPPGFDGDYVITWRVQ